MVNEITNENLWNILEQLNCGVLILNKDLELFYANEAVDHILDINREDIIGKKCSEFLCQSRCTNQCEISYLEISGNDRASSSLSINDSELELTYIKLTSDFYLVLIDLFNTHDHTKRFKYLLKKEEVNLTTLSESVQLNLKKLCLVKNITFNWINKTDHNTIFGSKDHLIYIFNNIIGKVVKLANGGEVNCVVNSTESGYAFIVSVSNEQTIINEIEKNKLIHKFEFELDKAKEFIELHGGKLWINLNNKLEFNFSIPISR